MTYRVIRATSKKQLALVLALDETIFPGDDRVSVNDAVWWLLMADNVPVGFAGLAIHPHYCFMRRAGVLRSVRGQGLHIRLIRARLAYTRSIGYPLAITYTASWNLASANNLLKCGFRLYKPRQEYGTKNAIYLEYRYKP